jgi:hypothetical protein
VRAPRPLFPAQKSPGIPAGAKAAESIFLVKKRHALSEWAGTSLSRIKFAANLFAARAEKPIDLKGNR